ncbi:MAG: right-handed parallel beta-helix repeat-containing protein, partial [Candidatus Omnitrophota bacterium]|nr:right-handed parallel beta-helix repeat-containing protein [Candidatus Omnitrophota bacterium]
SADIENNYIEYSATGVWSVNGGTVNVVNNTIYFCRGSYGGGIRFYTTSGLIKNNYIFGCWDGAINIYDSSNVDVTQNKIINNGSWDQAAGLNIGNSTVTLQNNEIRSNSVSNLGQAGGIYVSSGNISAFNNIFVANNGGPAGAIYANNSNLVVKNSIFTGNYGSTAAVYFTGTGTQDFSYNDMYNNTLADTYGITMGVGNITADPLFGDNYSLAAGSPCINAGDPDLQYNDHDGTRSDMGIYGGQNAPYASGKDFITFEAEDMDALNHIVAYNASGAWAGAYITSASSLESAHNLNIPNNGDYAVWVRMSAESDSSDAVAINIDGGDDIIIGDEPGNNSSGFRWINFEEGTPWNKVILYLAQGEHTLTLKDIEQDTKIDSIIITNNFTYAPPAAPPEITTWTTVCKNGLENKSNMMSKLKVYKDTLYLSTTDRSYKPSLYKINTDNNTYTKLKDMSTLGIPDRLYYTFDMAATADGGLYILLWRQSLQAGQEEEVYLVNTPNGTSNFSITKIGTGMNEYAQELFTYKDSLGDSYLYAPIKGTTNFKMKRSSDPMNVSSWEMVEGPLNPETIYAESVRLSVLFRGKFYVSSGTSSPRG